MVTNLIDRFKTELIGIDGGNVNSNLWFCGIEWGNWKFENPIDANVALPYYQCGKFKIPHINEEWIYKIKEDSKGKYDITKYPFDQKIAKLILTWKNGDFPSYGDYHQYMRDNLYRKECEIFKLNLFPISANTIKTWEKEHIEFTGFKNKVDYYIANQNFRFPLLRKLVLEYNPEVIVCIGRSYEKDFLRAFWGESEFSDIKFQEVKFEDSKNNIHIYKRDNEPTLVNIPFFGRYLNSNKDLKVLAFELRKLNITKSIKSCP